MNLNDLNACDEAANELFIRLLESDEFDSLTTHQRTLCCRLLARRATEYANDELNF